MRILLFFLLIAIFTICGYSQTTDSVKYGPWATSPVFTFTEIMPMFPGGDEALKKFLAANTKYPELERSLNIQGKVLVRFVVFEDGHVGDISIVRSVNKGLDNEAIRVTKLLPNFKPGMKDGQPVRVYYNLPFSFYLTNSK